MFININVNSFKLLYINANNLINPTREDVWGPFGL